MTKKLGKEIMKKLKLKKTQRNYYVNLLKNQKSNISVSEVTDNKNF